MRFDAVLAVEEAEELVRRFRLSGVERTIANPGFYAFRGDQLVGARDDDGTLLGFCACRVHRRPTLVGRYVVFDSVWVAPPARGLGVGRGLLDEAKRRAVGQDCSRWGSLAGTRGGAVLQLHAGHHCWGRTSGGDLVFDHPLRDDVPRPGPYAARRLTEPRLLPVGEAELLAERLP